MRVDRTSIMVAGLEIREYVAKKHFDKESPEYQVINHIADILDKFHFTIDFSVERLLKEIDQAKQALSTVDAEELMHIAEKNHTPENAEYTMLKNAHALFVFAKKAIENLEQIKPCLGNHNLIMKYTQGHA